MRLMRWRHRRAWALALPAGAHAAPSQDLRSPDARDAARSATQAQAQRELGPARSTKVIESTDQTLALTLASAAIGIALAGLAVGFGALLRRPRSRWSVN